MNDVLEIGEVAEVDEVADVGVAKTFYSPSPPIHLRVTEEGVALRLRFNKLRKNSDPFSIFFSNRFL